MGRFGFSGIVELKVLDFVDWWLKINKIFFIGYLKYSNWFFLEGVSEIVREGK